ncbi:Gti1/Pac2 family-domain-containing protein [Leptodontidium sp. 2 PMI_412]|nr:Gti1/Pac2 family-domain-containing protein [Leptodontidium sp. 2 PMI_412]
MASASPLSPTFFGHIASTQDALLLFEACLSGALNHVARRPHDRERVSLIKSGNVFIYEEHSSGIKRWTDGVPWSPSRILGNFLVYRELERPFPPGEKKRAMKRSKRSPGISKPEPFGGSGMSNGYNPASTAASTFDPQNPNSLSKETERSLIGSLVDSYGFKEEGLVKKTVSVTVGGVSHHLVSYYTVADVMNNKFTTPSKDPRFQHITPRPDLITKQNFRTPIDEVDSMDRIDDRSVNSKE